MAKLLRSKSSYHPRIVLAWFRECGLPDPEVEHRFHSTRLWRFDFAWPRWKLALEVEGGIFIRGAHGSVGGILRDMEKYNAAAILGWRVLRVLPGEVTLLKTIEMIKCALTIKP
jgi:hypothetical protein